MPPLPLPGWGLSPRVRGNLQIPGGAERAARSIPACAGEPAPHFPAGGQWEVYPRVCGGTPEARDQKVCPDGLSPRVRGNLSGACRRPACPRSIPACAGEPPGFTILIAAGEVYPRVCGGTRVSLPRWLHKSGLSPRVRGNRGRPYSCRSAEGVYPRLCGGTACGAAPPGMGQGLSPRVRGNRPPPPRCPPRPRSIPACAGEPAGTTPRKPPARVYPRVCGGTGRDFHIRLVGAGVYPRVCGGTGRPRRGDGRRRGLSPRVRGNQHRRAA